MPLLPPPRDRHGNVVPHDHQGISATDGVIRRISDRQIVSDGKGGLKVSSIAFKASSGHNAGMSVDLEALIIETGIDPKTYVTTPRWMGSVLFVARDLRSEAFQVGFAPLPDNPFHGEVWGTFTKSQQKKLLSMAQWYVPIEGVTLST